LSIEGETAAPSGMNQLKGLRMRNGSAWALWDSGLYTIPYHFGSFGDDPTRPNSSGKMAAYSIDHGTLINAYAVATTRGRLGYWN
jgi:hypothetical protein